MGLVCHVILLDHVIKGTRDYLPSVLNVALMLFIMEIDIVIKKCLVRLTFDRSVTFAWKKTCPKETITNKRQIANIFNIGFIDIVKSQKNHLIGQSRTH